LRSALLIATVNNPATRNRITGRPKGLGRTAVVPIAARDEWPQRDKRGPLDWIVDRLGGAAVPQSNNARAVRGIPARAMR